MGAFNECARYVNHCGKLINMEKLKPNKTSEHLKNAKTAAMTTQYDPFQCQGHIHRIQ